MGEQNFDWNDARETTLKELWAAGHASSQIAADMGLTRNAVLGKVHRLKLERRLTGRRAKSEYNTREKRPKRKVIVEYRRPKVVWKPLPKPVESPLEAPKSRDVPFSLRTEMQCSWIAGEPSSKATCCGHRVQDGSSYCTFHHRIVWLKPPSRAR